MTWWMWISLGLVLAAIELATPGGFYIIFFGLAALLVGALDVAGVLSPPWLQWLLFPLIALLALRLFRAPLMGRLAHSPAGGGDVDSLVGEVATTDTVLAPGAHGRAVARGSIWNVRNVAAVPLLAGQRCRVVAVHGLMLDLRPE